MHVIYSNLRTVRAKGMRAEFAHKKSAQSQLIRHTCNIVSTHGDKKEKMGKPNNHQQKTESETCGEKWMLYTWGTKKSTTFLKQVIEILTIL